MTSLIDLLSKNANKVMELLPKLSRKPSKTVFHLEKCPGDYFTDTRLCSNKSCPDISGSKGEYPVDPISERLQTTATYFAFTASLQRDFHVYIKTAVGRFLGSEEGGPSIKNVGFYFIGKTIGEGTFGKVKRGIHKISGCEVRIISLCGNTRMHIYYTKRGLTTSVRGVYRIL